MPYHVIKKQWQVVYDKVSKPKSPESVQFVHVVSQCIADGGDKAEADGDGPHQDGGKVVEPYIFLVVSNKRKVGGQLDKKRPIGKIRAEALNI